MRPPRSNSLSSELGSVAPGGSAFCPPPEPSSSTANALPVAGSTAHIASGAPVEGTSRSKVGYCSRSFFHRGRSASGKVDTSLLPTGTSTSVAPFRRETVDLGNTVASPSARRQLASSVCRKAASGVPAVDSSFVLCRMSER